jgi:hypothetical protein
MDQSAFEFQEADSESLHALAEQCVDYISGLENYFNHYSIEFWLLRRLAIDPMSWPGRLVGGLMVFLTVLLPALILTAITRQWASAPLASWTVVAVGIAGISIAARPLFRSAIGNFLGWIWAVSDEADLKRLLAWVRRWLSNQVITPVAGVLALGIVLSVYSLTLHDMAAPLPGGTLYIGFFLAYIVSNATYAVLQMAPQAYLISTFEHELYRLSPADSVVVRRSLRGYNQTGLVMVLITTAVILLFLILLPTGSRVAAVVVLVLLLIEYLCTAVGILIPRLLMGRMIRIRKEEEMKILQVRLNDLLPRLEALTEDEYERMQRLQEAQDAIRDSPENLLPLGEFAKVVGALLLSTLTVLITAFAQEWIAGLVKSLQL